MASFVVFEEERAHEYEILMTYKKIHIYNIDATICAWVIHALPNIVSLKYKGLGLHLGRVWSRYSSVKIEKKLA